MDYGFLTLILVAYIAPQGISAAYYGKVLGPVVTKAHSFSGDVYAASENSIVIRNLNYDGAGPDFLKCDSLAQTKTQTHDAEADKFSDIMARNFQRASLGVDLTHVESFAP
ncbi:hypothetical protein MTO96_051807 [Rhipicephalus appendiculatus]